MRTTKVDIKIPKRQTEWKLYCISDVHYGSQACDLTQLRTDIAKIAKEPNSYVILGGDNAEAITYDDPRFEPDLHDVITPKDFAIRSCNGIIKIYEPIKHKIIAGITGNHEEKFHKRHFFDMSQYIYDRLGVKYLGYCGLIHLNVGSCYGVRVFIHHGAGGGGRKGAKINRLMDVSLGFGADIYIMCHVHDQISSVEPYLSVTRAGEMYSSDRAFMVGGTYYKTYMNGSTTYGEMKMYRPVQIGSPSITIHENRNREVRFRV